MQNIREESEKKTGTTLGRYMNRRTSDIQVATEEKGKLVTWYFKPSQPQRIISGLKETFIERYVVERTERTI